jgi:hypothetical protein
MAICGARERQIPIQVTQAGDPFPLLLGLAETLHKRESAVDRPDHERYRSLPEEESEWTGQYRCHRKDAQNDIELAREDSMPQLPPGTPFKGDRKGISERG